MIILFLQRYFELAIKIENIKKLENTGQVLCYACPVLPKLRPRVQWRSNRGFRRFK